MRKPNLVLRTVALFVFLASVSAFAGGPKIGIYTGSFDPPHLGHRNIVLGMMKKFGLDLVYVVPDKNTQYKPNITAYDVRELLTEATFQDVAGSVKVLPSTLNSAEMNLWDFLDQVRKLHADAELFPIMGTDTYEWLRTQTANLPASFSKATVLVNERAGGAPLTADGLAGARVLSVDLGDQGFSSSAIRKAILAGEESPALSAEMNRIIREAGIYLPKEKRCPFLLDLVRNALKR